MKSLAELPSEVIAHILLGPHCSFLAIDLWKCGDLLLQAKLDHGVESIDLKDDRQVPVSHWPSCLSRFRKLRRLSVSLENGLLASSASELQLLLFSLAPGLEELRLISRDHLLSFPGDPALSDPSNDFGSLRKLELPQEVHSLFVSINHFYQLLTHNIRELSLVPVVKDCYLEASKYETQICSAMRFDWPPLLETFNGQPLLYNTLRHLPPSVTDVSWLALENGDNLPDFTRFRPTRLDLQDFTWTYEMSLAVPVTVTDLSLSYIGDCTAAGHWASTLPRALKTLTVEDLHLPVEFDEELVLFLPKTLTRLVGAWIAGNILSEEVFDLPNLKECYFWYDMPVEFASKFPSSLTRYSHHGEFSSEHPLPASITHAKFSQFSVFAPSIIVAPLLQSLDIQKLPLEAFKDLPTSLTSLKMKIGLDDPFTLSLPCLTSLELDYMRIKLFKFLPRTLTSLTCFIQDFGSNTELDISRFAELPASLKSLTMHSQYSTGLRIAGRCFTPCVGLEVLITDLIVDVGICKVVTSHLHNMRYMAFNMADGGRDQYSNGFPSRLVPIALEAPKSRTVKYTVNPQPKS